MNKETIKRILIAVAIAVGLLVVLKLIGSRGSMSGPGLMAANGQMEHMSNVNATSNDQRTGVDATAGNGATVVNTVQGASNTSTIGGTKQSLYSASSDPGVQSIRSQGCFPKEQLTPNELLPQDNSTLGLINPQGTGT